MRVEDSVKTLQNQKQKQNKSKPPPTKQQPKENAKTSKRGRKPKESIVASNNEEENDSASEEAVASEPIGVVAELAELNSVRLFIFNPELVVSKTICNFWN